MRPLALFLAALSLLAAPAAAQTDYAAQLKEGDVVLRDFRLRASRRARTSRDIPAHSRRLSVHVTGCVDVCGGSR